MDIKKQYDIIGHDYVEGQKRFYAGKPDLARDFIRKNLPPLKGKRILDMGCGGGVDVLFYEDLGADAYGIDISQFMVNESKRTVSRPENISLADMESTGFDDSFFDAVSARCSLHYLHDIDKGYAEIHRILKTSGVLVFTMEHPLTNFLRQKSRVYGKNEIVTVRLYDNKVPVSFPTHTLKEYLSGMFFDLFNLACYDEKNEIPSGNARYKSIPNILCIKAVKK